jgi:hypothetical protein
MKTLGFCPPGIKYNHLIKIPAIYCLYIMEFRLCMVLSVHSCHFITIYSIYYFFLEAVKEHLFCKWN